MTDTLKFTQEDLQNILTLIDFHDDWDEVKELYDIDLNSLFDKVHAALDNINDYRSIRSTNDGNRKTL